MDAAGSPVIAPQSAAAAVRPTVQCPRCFGAWHTRPSRQCKCVMRVTVSGRPADGVEMIGSEEANRMAQTHDLVVIGMGVGGEEVAGRTAEAGMDVRGIERKLVGGVCPYWGCIPSKIMVRAGNALAEAHRVGRVAGTASVTPDWSSVAGRIREATADWD